MSNKMNDYEAIAKAMQVRDDIRNYDTDKYDDMDFPQRKECIDALAQVINLAVEYIELLESKSQKTALELFSKVFAERAAKNG